MKKWVFFLTMFLLFSTTSAQAQTWQLDQDHTRFYFGIQHIYSTVRGEFSDFTGEISFDPDQPEKGHFNLTVKTASVNTSIGKRDTHLRSSEFFDVGKYPEMTYRSSSITKESENRYLIDGLMTIKDVTKKMPLIFTYHGQKDNPLVPGKVVAGLDTVFTLDRLAFNVGTGKFYKLGAVGKDVDVVITIEMLRDK